MCIRDRDVPELAHRGMDGRPVHLPWRDRGMDHVAGSAPHQVADLRSGGGAEIRYLMGGTTGDMIHSTVPPGQVNRATVHATVSEFWYVPVSYTHLTLPTSDLV